MKTKMKKKCVKILTLIICMVSLVSALVIAPSADFVNDAPANYKPELLTYVEGKLSKTGPYQNFEQPEDVFAFSATQTVSSHISPMHARFDVSYASNPNTVFWKGVYFDELRVKVECDFDEVNNFYFIEILYSFGNLNGVRFDEICNYRIIRKWASIYMTDPYYMGVEFNNTGEVEWAWERGINFKFWLDYSQSASFGFYDYKGVSNNDMTLFSRHSGNSLCFDDDYRITWVDLYTKGYINGVDFGLEEGYNNGYDQGGIDGYQQGYSEGETIGYNDGYEVGYSDGNGDGYSLGYDEGEAYGWQNGFGAGQNDMAETSHTFKEMVFAIFDAPSRLIDSMLNFDIFGINLAGVVKTILTLAIVAVIVIVIIKFVL